VFSVAEQKDSFSAGCGCLLTIVPMKKAKKKHKTTDRPSGSITSYSSIIGHPLFFVFALLFISLSIYSNSFTVPFQFDDFTSLVSNSAIRDIADIKALWRFSPTRFITYLTFAVNYHLHQLNVAGYHLINIGIHLGAALCVWWLALLTFSTPKMCHDGIAAQKQSIAVFAALLFAAHPLQTQAVTYIVQRLASLATLFYLLSLCLYVKGRLLQESAASRKIIFFCFSGLVLSAVTCMFTKETGFTLPVLVLCYECFFLQTTNIFKSKYTYVALLLLFIIPLTMFLTGTINLTLLRTVQEGPEGVVYLSSYQYLLTQARVLITYLRLLFLPVNQNLDYYYPIATTLMQPATFVSILFLLALAAASVWSFLRNRIASFVIVWFFITLAPESSFIPIKDVMFEHRLYLPMAGFSIFFSATAYTLLYPRHNRLLALFLITVIAGLSLLTYERNNLWKDDFSLWNDAAQKSPGKVRPFNNRGLAYSSRGDYEKAIADFTYAIQLNPKCAEAYYNRGLAYSLTGRYDLAIENYNQAITLYPNYTAAFNNRGLAYNHKQSYDLAIADFNRALQIRPDFAEAFYNLGLTYCYKKEYAQAIADFDQAVHLKPDYAEAYYNCGLARMYRKDFNKARADFDQAIVLNPLSAEAFNQRGLAYSALGEQDKAIDNYSRALALNANYLEVYYNRAKAYGSKGEHDKTIADLDQVLRIKPDSPEAWYARGVAYTYKKDYDKAIQDYSEAIRLNPGYAQAYNNRAVAYYIIKEIGKAQEDIKKLQSLGYGVDPALQQLLSHN
jgi:protein O-mannosyl-transferase